MIEATQMRTLVWVCNKIACTPTQETVYDIGQVLEDCGYMRGERADMIRTACGLTGLLWRRFKIPGRPLITRGKTKEQRQDNLKYRRKLNRSLLHAPETCAIKVINGWACSGYKGLPLDHFNRLRDEWERRQIAYVAAMRKW